MNLSQPSRLSHGHRRKREVSMAGRVHGRDVPAHERAAGSHDWPHRCAPPAELRFEDGQSTANSPAGPVGRRPEIVGHLPTLFNGGSNGCTMAE